MNNQNWNLKFSRRMSNQDTYHSLDDKIPPMAYVGVAIILALIFGFIPFLGYLYGYI